MPGDVAAAIGELKARQAGELAAPGGGALVRRRLVNGLVDGLDLVIHPAIIGQGARLFPDSGLDNALELVASRTTSQGITIQTDQPAGRPEYVTATADPNP